MDKSTRHPYWRETGWAGGVVLMDASNNQPSLDYENLRARLWEFEDIMGKQPELDQSELELDQPEPEEEEELQEGE